MAGLLPRRPNPTRLAVAAMIAALLFVAAAATALPEASLRLLAPLGAHGIHLLAAFALGRALLRLPGALPREALDILVTSVAAGLVGLSLLSLAGATLLGCPAWLPWLVDGIALVAGIAFGRLPDALRRLAEPWSRRDMAVIVASRLPLHLALCLAILLHVVPPFLPPSPGTGSQALALAAQAALRGDLGAASFALPSAVASPSQGLLLHGFLAGGSVGALLFGATALALLAAATWLHAVRHLGDMAAAWSVLLLLTVPLLLPATARDPSLTMLLAFGFLAFHEVADWCQKATGGKIALASIYGGFLVAESPRGLAAFAAVLVFLFLVQALIDRNGVLRQFPGLAGMTLIALLVALPFLALAGSLSPDGPVAQAADRFLPGELAELIGSGARDPDGAEAGAPSALADQADGLAAFGALLARRGLELGPLLLGFLVMLPLVPAAPEGLRQSLLGALLFAAVAMSPAPFGGGGCLALAPACIAAGAVATALIALRGSLGFACALFAVFALPASLVMALVMGPDTPMGSGLLLGRVSRAEWIERHVPDAPLIPMAESRRPPGGSLLLAGLVTDAYYDMPVRRAPGLGMSVALEDLLRAPDPVRAIAIDRATAPPNALRALAFQDILEESPDGRWAILGLERRQPAPAPSASEDEAPQPP